MKIKGMEVVEYNTAFGQIFMNEYDIEDFASV